MRKTAVYAAVSIMLSLLYTASLFGLQSAVPHTGVQQSVAQNGQPEKQLTFREVISLESSEIELHEIFRIPSSGLEEAQRGNGFDTGMRTGQSPAGKTGENIETIETEEPGQRPAGESRGRFNGIGDDSQPFGKNPAFIPFWQLSAFIKEEMRIEGRALVGKGSFYLPRQLSGVEKGVSIAVLREIKKRENNDKIRLELELSSVPENRIESRIGGDSGSLRDEMRAELITDSGNSLRFALYPAGTNTSEQPIAVVQAGVRRYVQGYSAVESMRKGDTVTAEKVKPAPVALSRTGSGGSGNSYSANNKARGNSVEGVSLGGLESGYEYTLKRDIKAGDLIKPSNLKITPPVERGDRLVCRFEKGSLVLTLDGKAVSSGGIGDMVRVRLSTGKYRELQVTGKGEVGIKLSGSRG